MNFLAGIDGGGTKTKVVCVTADGQPLDTRRFGPFNLNSIGQERFTGLLTEICEYLNTLGFCQALCIGSAGISNPDMARLVGEAMTRHGIGNWKLVGDQEIALWGALDAQPGIALIAGTGSICFGRAADGATARSGGWGHLIGDEGSGYALGRDALAAVARAMDGWGPETGLTALLGEELHLTTRQEIVAYTYGGDKSRVAALSRLVEEAAREQDAVALEIIRKNAGQMALLVDAVARKLGLGDTKVAMLGGMLENDTQLRKAFQEEMAAAHPRIACVAPSHDAATGAVMMAQAMQQ